MVSVMELDCVPNCCSGAPGIDDRQQADELYKICSVMGTPTSESWPEGLQLAAAMNFRFPSLNATPLGKLIPNACPEAIDLMTQLCSWDPVRRPTAAQALQHPYFSVRCCSFSSTWFPPPPTLLHIFILSLQSVPRMVPSVSPAARPYGAYTAAAAMAHAGPPMLGAQPAAAPTLEQSWRHPAHDRVPPPISVASLAGTSGKVPALPSGRSAAPMVKPTPRDVVNAETLAGLKSKIAAYRGPPVGQPPQGGQSVMATRGGPARPPSDKQRIGTGCPVTDPGGPTRARRCGSIAGAVGAACRPRRPLPATGWQRRWRGAGPRVPRHGCP